MDNVSHTLAGMLAAETLLAIRGYRRPDFSAGFRTIAWATSAVANNLPDSDLLYTAIDRGALGYLVHHRGHTHTLAFGAPLALVALLIPWLWTKRRNHRLRADEWGLLWVLALIGPLLHLALDFTNNYGVHPFWPIDNRWRYGDTIFIIEPYFWVVGVSLLWPSLRSRVAKVFWGLVLVAGVVVPWLVPFVPWTNALVLTVLAAVLLALGRSSTSRARMAVAVALSLLGVSVFAVASARTRSILHARASREFPDWVVRDVVVTPLPSNPLCLDTIAIMTRGSGEYALRRAQVAPWPGLRPVSRCPSFSRARPRTVSLSPLPATQTEDVLWEGELVMSLERLRWMHRVSCEGDAFLRFSRAPFLLEPDAVDLPVPVMGDLRYDNEEGLGFAEIPLYGDPSRCPKWIPPWVPPRIDVLE